MEPTLPKLKEAPKTTMWTHANEQLRPTRWVVRRILLTGLFVLVLSPALLLARQSDTVLDNGSPDAPVQPEQLKIFLLWNDPYQLAEPVFEQIAAEVSSIFGMLDARIQMNRSSSMNLGSISDRLLVLVLPEKPAGWPLSPQVMGVVSPSRPPVIRIFFRDVALTMGDKPFPIREGGSKERAFYLARGLARVLAHEIVHAIAPPHPHASEGLMNHRLTSEFLMKDQVDFDPICVDAFLKGLGNPVVTE